MEIKLTSTRNLTQEELDGYHRSEFVNSVLEAMKESHGREIRFLAVKSHHNLVTIKEIHFGEWEFGAGDKHFFSYHLSHVIGFIEALYDEKAKIFSLKGEIEIPSPVYLEANKEES